MSASSNDGNDDGCVILDGPDRLLFLLCGCQETERGKPCIPTMAQDCSRGWYAGFCICSIVEGAIFPAMAARMHADWEDFGVSADSRRWDLAASVRSEAIIN